MKTIMAIINCIVGLTVISIQLSSVELNQVDLNPNKLNLNPNKLNPNPNEDPNANKLDATKLDENLNKSATPSSSSSSQSVVGHAINVDDIELRGLRRPPPPPSSEEFSDDGGPREEFTDDGSHTDSMQSSRGLDESPEEPRGIPGDVINDKGHPWIVDDEGQEHRVLEYINVPSYDDDYYPGQSFDVAEGRVVISANYEFALIWRNPDYRGGHDHSGGGSGDHSSEEHDDRGSYDDSPKQKSRRRPHGRSLEEHDDRGSYDDSPKQKSRRRPRDRSPEEHGDRRSGRGRGSGRAGRYGSLAAKAIMKARDTVVEAGIGVVNEYVTIDPCLKRSRSLAGTTKGRARQARTPSDCQAACPRHTEFAECQRQHGDSMCYCSQTGTREMIYFREALKLESVKVSNSRKRKDRAESMKRSQQRERSRGGKRSGGGRSRNEDHRDDRHRPKPPHRDDRRDKGRSGRLPHPPKGNGNRGSSRHSAAPQHPQRRSPRY